MTKFSQQDHQFMRRAVELAARGLYTTDPNPRVGCVIVNDGQLVGEGWHRRAGEPHAEVYALEQAGERARGATVYLTLEPCSHHGRTPPCAEALLRAQPTRVVVAGSDPNPQVAGQGLALLQQAGIEVQTGLEAEQAEALNPGFLKRMRSGRPWVRLKVAASLDGQTALANGQSQWITGVEARRDVQHWRARSSALVTGIGTLLADDPSLNQRLDEAQRQPARVVLDSHLRTPPTARTLALPGQVLLFASSLDRAAALEAAGATVELIPAGTGGLDLGAVLDRLGELEMNEVLVEAGATLAGAFLAAGLVDELIVYLAPCLLGNQGRGMFALGELTALSDRVQLRILDVTRVGEDLRLIARPGEKH
jgi:diaminohydroxyphosphoribosylaminopyrimidine deaminase/5-amino-6-(5-phosphoribosylamino)uracil reductase